MKHKRISAAEASAKLYDELLVTLAKNGDRKAADLLVRRWHPRLLRTARRYTGDAGLAEQLAQECWIGILRGLFGLRDPSRFAPWAFTIMRKKGADIIRKSMLEAEQHHEPMDSSQAAQQEDRIAIAQAFAALPTDQRLAAHLHFVEGLTLSEIAAVQGVPPGTAKTRIFHARRKLKAALGEQAGTSTSKEI